MELVALWRINYFYKGERHEKFAGDVFKPPTDEIAKQILDSGAAELASKYEDKDIVKKEKKPSGK